MLANRICEEFAERKAGNVSGIPHETRDIEEHKDIFIRVSGKKLKLSIIDTPGISTKVDYEDFVKHGIPKEEAKKRAKEATKGVIDSVRSIETANAVIVVIDSSTDPESHVNLTIIGNLNAKKIPLFIAANKIDLKRSNIDKVIQAFPDNKVIGISAKNGDNIQQLYEELVKIKKRRW